MLALVAEIKTVDIEILVSIAISILFVAAMWVIITVEPHKKYKKRILVAPNKKSISCSVCNDKGSIQGRQCSCQVSKYWRNKCSKA